MPSYTYRAVHASGRISHGEMAAVNENELVHTLKESGLELIDSREKNQNVLRYNFIRKGISPRTLAAFCSRLHDLLLSGLSFPEALHDVQTSADNRVLADALAQISQAIANGKGIAAAFSLFPNLFPPLFFAIIGAGEKSGDMTSIFDFLSCYAATDAKAKERVHRALRYPLFLFLIAGGASVFMMTMVVPQIVQFLNGIEGHLPLSTRVLVSFSAFIIANGLFILSGVLVAVCELIMARRVSPSFAKMLDGLLLRLPVIGNVIAKTDIARFAHSFSILFRSGCPAADCLKQAGEVLGNCALRARAEKAEQRIQEGASLSRALDGVLPSFALGILRTGEHSGNLCKSLDDIVDAYDRESTEATDSFIGMLEPCLTLLIGGLLVWTVLAVMGPLYGSLSVLGGRM
jgi:type IV pilus assembly protein PilC